MLFALNAQRFGVTIVPPGPTFFFACSISPLGAWTAVGQSGEGPCSHSLWLAIRANNVILQICKMVWRGLTLDSNFI